MTKITNFVWNPVDDCVISELDGTGSVQAVYTNEPQQYGGVISQRRGTTTSTYHADALGTTRALTDGTQTTTDTYLNDAWGINVASAGTTVNPFKWVGKYGYYTDSSTAQVYVRARMYQPNVARWMSIDPFTSMRMRCPFIYVRNRLTLLIDPSGLLEEFPWPGSQDLTAQVFDTATTCNIFLNRPKLPFKSGGPTSDTLERRHFRITENSTGDVSAETFSQIYVSNETSWVVCCHEAPGECKDPCPDCCWECATDGAKTVLAYFVAEKSSWNGPDSALVLRHERYHLKIAEAYACMLRNADPGPQLEADCSSQKAFEKGQAAWRKRFEQAHDRIVAEWRAFDATYDNEVNHTNIDPTKQAEFQKRVDELKKKHCG